MLKPETGVPLTVSSSKETSVVEAQFEKERDEV